MSDKAYFLLNKYVKKIRYINFMERKYFDKMWSLRRPNGNLPSKLHNLKMKYDYKIKMIKGGI
jgi:hypothetical protein